MFVGLLISKMILLYIFESFFDKYLAKTNNNFVNSSVDLFVGCRGVGKLQLVVSAPAGGQSHKLFSGLKTSPAGQTNLCLSSLLVVRHW